MFRPDLQQASLCSLRNRLVNQWPRMAPHAHPSFVKGPGSHSDMVPADQAKN